MTALVDTNILVYCFDRRFPEKQARAQSFLGDGLADNSIRIAHQAIVEFVAVVSRLVVDGAPLLPRADARREAEQLLTVVKVLYPNDAVIRVALRGMAAYGLSWFDAHMWAYAEVFGTNELISEDFQAGRLYGSVRIVNPFLG